jgi:hypothetical protein
MKTNEKTNTDRMTSLGKGTQMNPQKIARVTGVLFVITYITSIPPVFFSTGLCWTTPATSSVVAPPTTAAPWARCWS